MFFHAVVFVCVAMLAAFISNGSGGVGLLFMAGFYGGSFKAVNKWIMKICHIPLENKKYHEEDRKREEAEKERITDADRSWFGKLIDRLRC